jgi:coenzyme F420-reducing hydrogenase alpha subunit
MSKYPQRVKQGLTVPWGYRQNKYDQQLLDPIDEQLDLYEEGKKLVRKGCSLRDVAQWMSAATGRKISHVGLQKKIQDEESKKKSKAAKIAWERRRARIEEAERKLDDNQQERTQTKTEEETEGRQS